MGEAWCVDSNSDMGGKRTAYPSLTVGRVSETFDTVPYCASDRLCKNMLD